MRPRQVIAAEKRRRESSRVLAILLEEFGLEVLAPGERGRGRRVKVAGGLLYLALRKARKIRDLKTGEIITIPESRRLVWRGPSF
jgi:nucleoid DNA-binding protein